MNLDAVQERILAIFKVVAELCERNGISYYAIGGTCLGAVRHKGFIPWDDDLDIAIPIEEFSRFLKIAYKELPSYYEVYTPAASKHNSLGFIKIMDSRTMMTETYYSGWSDSYMGVWIDVMPIGGVPDDIGARKRFLLIKKCFRWIAYRTKSSIKQQKNIIDVAGWILCRPFYWILPRDFFWKRWLKYQQKYSFGNSKNVGYVWSNNLPRLIFPHEWFDDFTYLDFEDTQIRCPKEWDKFLTQMFGNYMEYPPVEKRKSHLFDDGFVDLDHSYKEYQAGERRIRKKE